MINKTPLPKHEFLYYNNIPLPAYTLGSISLREKMIALRLSDIQNSMQLLQLKEANNKMVDLLIALKE